MRLEGRLALALILVLGLGLRLYGLAAESFWLDECVTLLLASRDPSQIAAQALVVDDWIPPLYAYLLHGWIRVWGDSEFAARTLSVFCGTASLVYAYAIGKRLYGPREGLLAALFLAVAPFQVHYSQEVRSYALYGLAALGSTDAFLRLAEPKARWPRLWYAIWTAILLYSHVYAVSVMLAQSVMGVLDRGRLPYKRWLQPQAVAVLAWLPWLVALAAQTTVLDAQFSIGAAPMDGLRHSVIEWSGSHWATAVLGLLALAGLMRPGRGLLGLTLAFALLLPVGMRMLGQPFEARYTIGAAGAFCLLAASGLGRIRPLALALLVAAVPLGLGVRTTVRMLETPNKEQWREMAALLETEAGPGDLVLFNAGFTLSEAYGCYRHRQDLDTRPFPPPRGLSIEPDSARQLETLVAGRPRVWLVLSHERDTEGRIREMLLESRYAETLHRRLIGIDLYQFRK